MDLYALKLYGNWLILSKFLNLIQLWYVTQMKIVISIVMTLKYLYM